MGVRLHTRCSKGLFGGLDIEYLEQHFEPSESECVTGVHKVLDGTADFEAYPVESCSWMRTNTETKTFIKITKRNVMYDPYENVAVSELFQNMKCLSNFCPTIHQGQFWLPNEHHRPTCIKDHLDKVIFFIQPKGRQVMNFWSPDFNAPSGHQLCTMKFCGMYGFLFHDNTWIGVDKAKFTTDPDIKYFMYDVPECNKTTRLNLVEEEYSVHVAEETLLDKFLETECLKTKESLILGEPVSRVQLQSLAPRVPGLHRVYRLINGTIETGVGEYRLVALRQPTGNNPIVVEDSSGTVIRWNYWTYDKKHNIIDGPNGLFLHNNVLSFHNMNIEEYQNAVALSLKQVIPLPGVSIKSRMGKFSDEVSVTYNKVNDESLSAVQLFHWPKKINLHILRHDRGYFHGNSNHCNQIFKKYF